MFASETWIIDDVEALEFKEPAQFFIDCLRGTVVISFDKKDIFKSSLTSKQIIENMQLLYKHLGGLQRRILMFIWYCQTIPHKL